LEGTRYLGSFNRAQHGGTLSCGCFDFMGAGAEPQLEAENSSGLTCYLRHDPEIIRSAN
jgi:hypothetical protein